MLKQFNYNAFGIKISSDFECYELPVFSTNNPDVKITSGIISDLYYSPPIHIIMIGVTFYATSEYLLLCINKLANYLVNNGNSIIVEPHPEADPDLLRLFLFGSAFGALLFQRGILPLHGCSIITPRGAAVFLGHSGYGKSTLAGIFHKRGYSVLSDDVSAVTSTDGVPHIIPSYPRMLLWSDTMEHIGLDSTDLKLAHARENKYQVPISNSSNKPSPLYAIYILNPTNTDEIEITPINGFDKINALTEHTYRGQFLEAMKLTSQHFTHISSVARHACIKRIDRPIDINRIEELADQIEKDFLQDYN